MKRAQKILFSVASGTIKSIAQLKNALRTGVRIRLYVACDLHEKAFLKSGQQWQLIDYHSYTQARKQPAPMGTRRVTMRLDMDMPPTCQCVNLQTINPVQP